MNSGKDSEKIGSNEKYNLDAWMIKNKYNLKTINGYSGQGLYSFCYVDDLIDGIVNMMNSEERFIGSVNLGNPE